MTVSIRRFLWIVALGATLVFFTPATSLAQGRGRGRGPDLSKKSRKFVNGHDARDGRWDGRGPRRYSNSRGIFVGRSRNHRRWRRSDLARLHRLRRMRGEDVRFSRRRFTRIR